ncbi:response regulator [Aurantiacibacter hainanensis]|uniref:response regulator n=1 Tax=Aurantiacibacter hainanensis TaxID=3076114 RepID=UPI0030C6BEDD
MASQARAPKDQPTVLVVEDEVIIALDLSETVRDMGYRVEGPYANNSHAMIAIDQELPDFAILDVMTADGEVFPLADALTDAGVPIIFHSGHFTSREIAERYPDAQAAEKPCPPSELIAMMSKAKNKAH